jgi:ADP-glucose pyrophosphorylase
MDYTQMISQHRQTGADVTLAVIPCSKASASQYGVLQLDDRLKVQVRAMQAPLCCWRRALPGVYCAAC